MIRPRHTLWSEKARFWNGRPQKHEKSSGKAYIWLIRITGAPVVNCWIVLSSVALVSWFWMKILACTATEFGGDSPIENENAKWFISTKNASGSTSARNIRFLEGRFSGRTPAAFGPKFPFSLREFPFVCMIFLCLTQWSPKGFGTVSDLLVFPSNPDFFELHLSIFLTSHKIYKTQNLPWEWGVRWESDIVSGSTRKLMFLSWNTKLKMFAVRKWTRFCTDWRWALPPGNPDWRQDSWSQVIQFDWKRWQISSDCSPLLCVPVKMKIKLGVAFQPIHLSGYPFHWFDFE